MPSRRLTVAALLAALSAYASFAKAPAKPPDAKPAAAGTPGQEHAATAPASGAPSARAEAYFDYTMGHIFEQQYENTSKADFATRALDFYKKAYALDPRSPVIGERLAEMYWKAQRIREAINEAQEILKRDPNDVTTRRLLARIYLRSLGDLNAHGS